MTLLKRALLSITTFVTLAFTMNAQQYQDVVYLKNGSVIRGLITEQIPNKSLKIETTDGSIFICDMNDINKITKEYQTKENKVSGQRSEYGWVAAPRYRGFVGDAVVIGTGEFELTRSHFSHLTDAKSTHISMWEEDLRLIIGLIWSQSMLLFLHMSVVKYTKRITKEFLRISKQE